MQKLRRYARLYVDVLERDRMCLCGILAAEYATLPEYLCEPLDTMAEAALALCTADPTTLTGQVTTSLQLLVALDRPVHDVTGRELLAEWQPARLPSRIEKMRRHMDGEITSGPTGVEHLTNRGRP